jgi:hypothetical protein
MAYSHTWPCRQRWLLLWLQRCHLLLADLWLHQATWHLHTSRRHANLQQQRVQQ